MLLQRQLQIYWKHAQEDMALLEEQYTEEDGTCSLDTTEIVSAVVGSDKKGRRRLHGRSEPKPRPGGICQTTLQSLREEIRREVREEVRREREQHKSQFPESVQAALAMLLATLPPHLRVGNFLHCLSRFITGFAIGFCVVWQTSLATVLVVPLIGMAGGLYAYITLRLTARVRKSYVQADEIAEEIKTHSNYLAMRGVERVECQIPDDTHISTFTHKQTLHCKFENI